MKNKLLLIFVCLGTCRIATAQWTQINMQTGRWYHSSAIVEGKLIIAGGLVSGFQPINSVEIYDIEAGTWSDTTLSEARAFMGTAVLGSKVYFAGGGDLFGGISDQIDVYDASTGEWSTMNLLEPRAALSAAAVGGKLFFAGGGTISYPNYFPSGTVEIYDTSGGGGWEYDALSEARMAMAATVAGDKAFFAGGVKNNTEASSRVDIYNAADDSWDTVYLSQPRFFLSATTAGDKILFAGGTDPLSNDSDVVDIYGLNGMNWDSPATFPVEAMLIAAATLGNKACFAGGSTVDDNLSVEDPTNALHIYDPSNDNPEWEVEYMETPRVGASAAVWGNQLFISGGFNWDSLHLNSIEIYTDTTLVNATEMPAPVPELSLYPNPNKGQFSIELPRGISLPATIRLYDLKGREAVRKNARAFSQTIDVSHLQAGAYLLGIYAPDGRLVAKKRVVIAP
ncbi:MAG: T9SS type A sorting domain-containing protein [Phaeodactylibacter sp.]|nr:T9SS type A sorting domain-containing protein [Phaeodactylibacter sp.]MCB9293797.1 T9SS type A sorting domain-containing protein [Lewinellaceae bacterium]